MARAKIRINQKQLKAAIQDADAMGLDSQIAALGKAAELYTERTGQKVSPSLIRSRADEVGIKIYTKGSRGRATAKVDRKKLENAVEEAEKDGAIPEGKTRLYEIATEIYNGMEGIPQQITQSVASQRIRDWGIPFITKSSKMSEDHKRKLHSGGRKRTPRAEKFARDPAISAALVALKRFMPNNDAMQNRVQNIANGSLKIAVEAKCLDCSGMSSKNVRLCPCIECPLWAFRPFQRPETNGFILNGDFPGDFDDLPAPEQNELISAGNQKFLSKAKPEPEAA